MENPFFTVILPLYNKGKYIVTTLQSVLSQTFEDFEVIVVDDGSTDDGPDKVASIKDSRIRLIRKENGGVSSARNRGIAEAKGNYIAFLDADDEWRPQMLSTFYDFFSNHNCQWAVSGYTRRYKSRQTDLIFGETRVVPDALEAIADGLSIWTGAVIIKRSCFTPDFLFNTQVSRSEDREVWIKLACQYPEIGFIGKALAVYNTGISESLTRTGLNRDEFDFLSMENRVNDFTIVLPEKRKKILKSYFWKFNRNAFLLLWTYKSNLFKNFDIVLLKNHLSKSEIKILTFLNPAPVLIKKIIAKYIRLKARF